MEKQIPYILKHEEEGILGLGLDIIVRNWEARRDVGNSNKYGEWQPVRIRIEGSIGNNDEGARKFPGYADLLIRAKEEAPEFNILKLVILELSNRIVPYMPPSLIQIV